MRYAILVFLNLPIIILAFINVVTLYKMKKISKSRFWQQVLIWLVILIVLLTSFPVYNMLMNFDLFDSSRLSGIDIVQTTAIIYLVYIVNDHRRKIDRTEKIMRELHQELSILLSNKN